MSEFNTMCYENGCHEKAYTICKKCDGEFCAKHYELNHPKGVCIHY